MKRKFRNLSIASILLITVPLSAQLRVGDPGVTFDASKYDSGYPQMREWEKAGVLGGIPFLSDVAVKKTITATNSAGINSALEDVANQGGGQLRLKNGAYTIDAPIKMKNHVRLVGESESGVKLTITMTTGKAIGFDEVEFCGIENMTIEGGFGIPNDFVMKNVKPDLKTISVNIDRDSKNCWVDNVTILNSGRHPLAIRGSHNTVRDCYMERVWNKGASWNGYFHISGSYNLVFNNTIKKLRHFSMQDSGAHHNVVYKNIVEQDINFHNNDGGDNLVEQNISRLPAGMRDIWSSIMGPWSSRHKPSAKDNYVYRNDCIEYNNAGRVTFSDDNKVYLGPRRHQKSEIPGYPYDFTTNTPKGGTFYPVVLGGASSVPAKSGQTSH